MEKETKHKNTPEKKDENHGFLALVSTPIGNLKDITLRALEILKEADFIAAEDTRRAKILLTHYGIKKQIISYHAFNEHQYTSDLLKKVQEGHNIAVLSDAGTPGISDPGFLLVREAVKIGIEPLIIPGVSSLTFAAIASGLPLERFAFYGFLPVKEGRRKNILMKIAEEDKTVFVFESPYRINKLLNEISELIGPQTGIALIREATKFYEEILRGTVSEILESTKERKWKGECVVGILPMKRNETDKPESWTAGFQPAI